MNAWAFGTAVLITFICVCGILANNVLDRWFRIRFHDAIERQRPHPRARVIDVSGRATPPGWENRGAKAGVMVPDELRH